MMGISIIVPTYNERENIDEIIGRCLRVLDDYDVELIVVDDDSPDLTWEYAEELYGTDPRVQVIRRLHDRGLATAVADGFRAATKEYCAVIDADLQHPPEKLPELLAALDQDADIAIGSRHVEGGGIENWSRARKLVSSGATQVAKACVPEARGISDPMSGFFAARRDIVAGIELNPKGYKILLELLTKCEYDTVVEVPYVFTERERGESKLSADQYQNFVEHTMMLGSHSYGLTNYVSPERFVRVAEFAFVGAVGVVVNMLVFMLVLGTGFHHVLAGIAAFLVAVNANFFGNWALTFDRPDRDVLKMWGRFHVVSLTGFVLYTAVLSASIEVLLLPALVANAVAICSSSVFNFLGSEKFAFEVEDAGDEQPTGSTNPTGASD